MRSGARLIFEEPDIGTARTLVGTGIIEEVEDLYLSVVRTFGTTRRVTSRTAGLVVGLILSGELAVQQAPMFYGLTFDPFALFADGLGPAEVGVGWRNVV